MSYSRGMVRLILIAAFLAAACGSKSKPSTEPGDTTEEGDDTTDESGVSLAEVAPELDALNTEIGSIRDLPVEERDVEVCEANKSLARMVEDLTGATPAGVDVANWEAAVDQMNESLDDVKGACPDDVDALDAAFTQLLDALDALVETTERDATGPAA